MAIEYRSELKPFFEEFVDSHRGVRFGKMFGLPAIYAGRRLFTCLIEDGLIVRLPPEIAKRELRKGAKPYSERMRPGGTWMMYRPRSIVAARRLVPVLELAAREVARQQVEDMTGVRISGK